MSDQNKKEESGLSVLANITQPMKMLVPLLGGLILIVLAGSYFYMRAKPQPIPKQDETYHTDDAMVATPVIPIVNTGVNLPTASGKSVEATKPTKEELAALIEQQKELQQRLAAPLMAVNNAVQTQAIDTPAEKQSQEANPNLRFMEQVANKGVETVSAVPMGSLSTQIAQGSFIHAILESATNSDLPRFLRAIVSEPVYSEDGKNILIPRGSRLVGEYKSGMLQGQSRIFIVWSRVITPMYSIQLGSPGTDSLGVSGMGADVIDRHFWQRFGMASLLSMLGTGAANMGVTGTDQNNSASAYRTAVANSFSQSASESLQQDGLVAPTLKTYQGKPIMVFVAKDLDFMSAMKTTTSSINVF